MVDESLLAEAEARWWVYCYKVQPCLEPMPHDWATCPQSHHNEKAARRCPRAFQYAAMRCPQRNKKSPAAGDSRAACSKGDACGCAHTVYELWLHPDRFRTQMCLHGQSCTKPLCFFAHSASELRAPPSQQAAPVAAAPAAAGAAPAAAPKGAIRIDEERDPAEALVELHAAAGGGRFSLAAALAEVQLRQRRLYGSAPPGAAPPPPAAAHLAPPPPAWQLALLQASALGQAPGALPPAAAAAALAADPLASAAAAQQLLSPVLLQQLLTQQKLGGNFPLCANGGLVAPLGGAIPAPGWPAAAGIAGGAWPAPRGGWDAAGSPAAAAPLLAPPAPAGKRSSSSGNANARRESLLWALNLDACNYSNAAAACSLASGLEDLVTRTASGASADALLSACCAAAGCACAGSFTTGGGTSRAGSARGSGCGSPVSARGPDSLFAGGSPPAASLLSGLCSTAALDAAAASGAAAARLAATAQQAELHQQLERLRLEHEAAALRLQVLQLQCQQGGLPLGVAAGIGGL